MGGGSVYYAADGAMIMVSFVGRRANVDRPLVIVLIVSSPFLRENARVRMVLSFWSIGLEKESISVKTG
jgi:hypothetical protein